jgi:hypothetical protein
MTAESLPGMVRLYKPDPGDETLALVVQPAEGVETQPVGSAGGTTESKSSSKSVESWASREQGSRDRRIVIRRIVRVSHWESVILSRVGFLRLLRDNPGQHVIPRLIKIHHGQSFWPPEGQERVPGVTVKSVVAGLFQRRFSSC